MTFKQTDYYEVLLSRRDMRSANGVPYPLDEWLALQNKMTTEQCAELLNRWK